MSSDNESGFDERAWNEAFDNGDPVWFSFGARVWSAGVIKETAWGEVYIKSDAPKGKVHTRQYSQIRHRDPAKNGTDKPPSRKQG